jgi:predicted phosphate transport protein (TIGR00153 family)
MKVAHPMRLLPREEKFYILFNNQATLIAEASRLLLEGVTSGNSRLAEVSKEIRVLEHRGDEVIHEIFRRLNQTFITPIDPEDIHALSTKLDDVLDGIEDAVYRLVAYRVEPIPETIVRLSEIVVACSKSVSLAVQALEKNEKLIDHCIDINRLENEADRLLRSTIADLFNKEKDCIVLIKLKEVYELLEATTDRCEDVADVLQNVVVKNS